MCPRLKYKSRQHPLLNHSFYNSQNITCVTILTHDVLSAESPYIICTECYNPTAYNKVLTLYTHTFQYGTVPVQKCALCNKVFHDGRPLIRCPQCIKAYYTFQGLIKPEEEATYDQLVGLSVNVKTLKVEYGVSEIRIDPNDPEILEEIITS